MKTALILKIAFILACIVQLSLNAMTTSNCSTQEELSTKVVKDIIFGKAVYFAKVDKKNKILTDEWIPEWLLINNKKNCPQAAILLARIEAFKHLEAASSTSSSLSSLK